MIDEIIKDNLGSGQTSHCQGKPGDTFPRRKCTTTTLALKSMSLSQTSQVYQTTSQRNQALVINPNAPVAEHGVPVLAQLPEHSPILLKEETIDITVTRPQEAPRKELTSEDWTAEQMHGAQPPRCHTGRMGEQARLGLGIRGARVLRIDQGQDPISSDSKKESERAPKSQYSSRNSDYLSHSRQQSRPAPHPLNYLVGSRYVDRLLDQQLKLKRRFGRYSTLGKNVATISPVRDMPSTRIAYKVDLGPKKLQPMPKFKNPP